MQAYMQIPEWLGAAVMTGLLAAIGYIAKMLLEWLANARAARAARFARLVELQSLLRAARVSFLIQNEHAQGLQAMINQHHSNPLLPEQGYEHLFAEAYPKLIHDEKELHGLIRSITINSLHPTNQSLQEWLKKDTYFKAQWHRKGVGRELAAKLSELDAHLILWQAKYEAWIPNHEEHALVYLADEERHGVGFPQGLDKIVDNAFEDRSLFSG